VADFLVKGVKMIVACKLYLVGILTLSLVAPMTSRGDTQEQYARPMRVDCSLIQGAPAISIMAEPRLSARVVTNVKCGDEVKVFPSQDGWTKVVSLRGMEGYIGSWLLREIALPDDKPTTSVGPFGALPAQPTYMPPVYRVDGSEPTPPQIRISGPSPGIGPGVGPGHGGAIGDGAAYRVGGTVTPPRALYTPDPEYSAEALHAKYQGTLVLWLIVGPDGKPRDIRVTRALGMGLDQKAIEAVNRWRFEPAMKDGRPVAVQINVEVNFRLGNNGPQPPNQPTKATPEPKVHPSQPDGWQTATVLSQNINYDSGVGAYLNYVEAQTKNYRYRWMEKEHNHMLVVIVNSELLFYQDGPYFIMFDAKHHKHKFLLMGMTSLARN
jgi:TonB family protein